MWHKNWETEYVMLCMELQYVMMTLATYPQKSRLFEKSTLAT